jgi:BclA C-terminal domain
MYSLIQPRTLVSYGRDRIRSRPLRRGFHLITLILVSFGLLAQLRAAAEPQVVPPPDGSYPGGNTAEGFHALFSRTTGTFNAALGWQSLTSLTNASYNTGVGAGTLTLNNANENTATGAGALLLNTTGAGNTSNGALALVYNSVGSDNTAVGDRALENNGHNAGGQDGNSNSAVGSHAIFSNTTGDCNSALGGSALLNLTTGDNNVAIGCNAGSSITTGSNNIYINNLGVDNESNTIRIGDPAIITQAFIAGIPAGGLAAILFDYNTGAVVVGVGGAVPFSQAPLIVGTAISKNNNTTFMVNRNGVFRVSYTLRTAVTSLMANVQVRVNGTGVGPTAALAVAGTSLSDQVTFPANAGDTLQLVVGGSALTLGSGDNATINIDKVQ